MKKVLLILLTSSLIMMGVGCNHIKSGDTEYYGLGGKDISGFKAVVDPNTGLIRVEFSKWQSEDLAPVAGAIFEAGFKAGAAMAGIGVPK